MKIFIEYINGNSEEVSVEKLKNFMKHSRNVIELVNVDDEGNMYFEEVVYAEYFLKVFNEENK